MNNQKLAEEFSSVLKTWLTPEQMTDVVDRNTEEPNDSVCHTHDFCDANMAMAEAFEKVMGREFDFGSDDDSNLFNQAWDIAKANRFFSAN